MKQAQVLVLLKPCGDCEVEKRGSSSSTSSGDNLSDKENLPSDTKEGVAISRATQARPKAKRKITLTERKMERSRSANRSEC